MRRRQGAGSVRERLRGSSGPAALVISCLALLLSTTGAAEAAREALVRAVSKPKPGAVLKLGKNGKFPSKAIPKVESARSADTIGGFDATELKATCGAEYVDIGTWCLSSATYSVPSSDAGKNDYFYATRACSALGGFLPSAAQLIGAADRVKLNSYLTDSQLTASVDILPEDGLSDRREMSSTLITTQGGATSAGALGVSDGARGNPQTGEPNPVVVPAVPAPDTLQYVTVVDNGDRGGFAGSKPVSQSEAFRCGVYKSQGEKKDEES